MNRNSYRDKVTYELRVAEFYILFFCNHFEMYFCQLMTVFFLVNSYIFVPTNYLISSNGTSTSKKSFLNRIYCLKTGDIHMQVTWKYWMPHMIMF